MPLLLREGAPQDCGGDGGTEEGGGEESDENEVPQQGGAEGGKSVCEGGCRRVGGQPVPAQMQITQDGFQLEVGANHCTDVEQLVAVPCGGAREKKQ